MYCPKREENRAKREAGEKTKYVNPVVGLAWQTSVTGTEFKQKLEEKGYQLAQGDRCIVIVDPKGKPSSASRTLDMKRREFEARLGEDTIANLKSLQEVQQQGRSSAQKTQDASQKSEAKTPRMIEFEEEKAEAMNRLELRQFDEVAECSARESRKIMLKKEQLDKFYNFAGKKEAIDALEQKQAKSNFFHKLFGIHKKRENELQNLKRGFADARNRFGEVIKPMEQRRVTALKELKEAHMGQRRDLAKNMELWRPQEQEPKENLMERRMARQREHFQERQRGGLEGPGFER